MVSRVDPSGPAWRKVLRMENEGDLWMDMSASAGIRHGLSAASILENQGSEGSSSHFGVPPSRSSSSSARNSSTDGTAEAIARLEDGEVHAMLQDPEVRAVLRKVTIKEGALKRALQSLGDGEKSHQSLMEHNMAWVKQQRNIQPSSPQPPPPPPSNPFWNFSTAQSVDLQPSSDAFQVISGSLQRLSSTQLLEQEMRYTQRLKSRKLTNGEPEMGAGPGGVVTGFCPSSFISSPEDYKSEVTIPDIMAPCIPQQQPVTPFTSGRTAMPFAKPTPAMATKAARRHRMTRQRQSFHARVASSVATSSFSVGYGSLWNTDAASSPAVTCAGLSGAQTPSPSGPVTAAREPRSMECLTFVLQKELRPSDVSNLGRIILPKKDAEKHLPPLATREGISIEMEDFDSGQAWNLRFRFWPNNRSRMYVLENTAEFVTVHGLVEGDLLIIYRVLQGGYVLRGMKKKNGRLDHIEPVQVEFAYSSARGSVEVQPSLHGTGTLVQRLDKCCPSDRPVKEGPVYLDDDAFLNDVILSMGSPLESDSSCIQTLEWFPSLTLDFPFEEIMPVTS